MLFLDEWLRSCAICGLTCGRIDLCCQACWQQMRRAAISHKVHSRFYRQGLPVVSLWEWNGETSEWLEPLLYQLKGGGPSSLFAPLGEWLAWQGNLNPNSATAIVIPAPPRTPGEADHAHRLAEAVGRELCLDVRPVLRRVHSAGAQKQKGREERLNVQMDLSPAHRNTWEPGRTADVVFVDDVVTTGATALAAFRALGEPKGFSVRCLCTR